MIESLNSKIDRLVVHQIGCKAEGGQLKLSREPLRLDDAEDMADVLRLFFFKPFKTEAYFNLSGEEGPESNILYQHVTTMFENRETFLDESMMIAELLYEASNHPKIRGGELYVAHFTDCVVDGMTCDAVGIFKSESKETFLRVYTSNDDNIELGTQEGISIRRLDKGCIIFNIEQEDGYRVCAVDNINKGAEARFWMDDFLGVKPRQDNYYFTDNYMQMCKGFVTDVFNEENHVPRTEQVDMLNRTVDFFQKNPKFSHSDFAQNVMEEPDIIREFNDYKQRYEEQKQLPAPLPDVFEVSADAVKGEKKNFKSVIKLDKNFHVYVHGSRYYMEKGYDEEKDLNYYKLFFKMES
ncbi:MAG: nucleoid-associated protein [Bacteroidales bacterium]|nr:nucleoid-associated protein [Bacteroidales bacterium]